MAHKKIYLIRHGETEYNKRGVVQGSGIDSGLNETGQQQAEAFYRYYKAISFDKVYISGLKRTYESVRSFIEKEHLPFEKLDGLNEISWGIHEGKPVDDGMHLDYLNIVKAWQSGQSDARIPEGESPLQVLERQKQDWPKITAAQNENTVLVCMHGRAMRILLSWLMNTPLQDMDQYSHKNLCLYLLSFDGEKYTLELRNDLRHLEALSV